MTKTKKIPTAPKSSTPDVEHIKANQVLAEKAAEMLVAVREEDIVLQPWMTAALEDENAILAMRSDKQRTQVQTALDIAVTLVNASRDRFTVVTAASWCSQYLQEGWRSLTFGWVLEELEAIEFLEPEQLDLRVQPAGPRKHTASALKVFFTKMVESLDEKADKAWIDELKPMVANLTEVVDRADAAIKAKKAKAEAKKAENGEKTDEVESPAEVEQ